MEVLERFAHGDLNASEDTMVWPTTWEASNQGDLSIDMHLTHVELGSGRSGTNVCAEEETDTTALCDGSYFRSWADIFDAGIVRGLPFQ